MYICIGIDLLVNTENEKSNVHTQKKHHTINKKSKAKVKYLFYKTINTDEYIHYIIFLVSSTSSGDKLHTLMQSKFSLYLCC